MERKREGVALQRERGDEKGGAGGGLAMVVLVGGRRRSTGRGRDEETEGAEKNGVG